jgi:hypothetical protein
MKTKVLHAKLLHPKLEDTPTKSNIEIAGSSNKTTKKVKLKKRKIDDDALPNKKRKEKKESSVALQFKAEPNNDEATIKDWLKQPRYRKATHKNSIECPLVRAKYPTLDPDSDFCIEFTSMYVAFCF